MQPPLIFDGHNDVLCRLYGRACAGNAPDFVNGNDGHIDLLKTKQGGFAGGFFPFSFRRKMNWWHVSKMREPQYNLPLPSMVPFAEANRNAWAQVETLLELEKQGSLKICTDVEGIQYYMASGKIAAILHMEDAEAIDPEFAALDTFYVSTLASAIELTN